MDRFCIKCGHQAIEGASFCYKCGTKIVEEKKYPASEYCDNCGTRREENRTFCMSCFQILPEIDKDNVASVKQKTIHPNSNSSGNLKKHQKAELPLLNIFVNIAFAISLLIMNSYMIRYVEIGDSSSGSVLFFLVLLAGAYLITAVLHNRRKSYSLLIPTIITVLTLIPSIDLYNDFKEWISYEGLAFQSAVGNDTVDLLMLYLIILFLTPVISLVISVRENKV